MTKITWPRGFDPGLLSSQDHLVVFTGAGVSAESGVATFRDSGGLWEQHSIEDVATPEAWERQPEYVLDFYNKRRKQLSQVSPNRAHQALAELEKLMPVTIITQNVDDLHERAGSNSVIHLHGELGKVQSSLDPEWTRAMSLDEPIEMGMTCDRGSQLRPHVVWFGEPVPMMEKAQKIVEQASFLLVVGSSLQVYPAAGLVTWASGDLPVLLIDPQGAAEVSGSPRLAHWPLKAAYGVPQFHELLREKLA